MKHISNLEYQTLMEEFHKNNAEHEIGNFSVTVHSLDMVSGESSESEYKVSNGKKINLDNENVYLFWNEYSDNSEYIIAKDSDLRTEFELVKKEGLVKEEKQEKQEKQAQVIESTSVTPFEFIKKRMDKDRKEKKARKILEFLKDNEYLPEVVIENDALKVSVKDIEGVSMRNYELPLIESEDFTVDLEGREEIEEIFPMIPDVENITMDGEKISLEEVMKHDYELAESLQEVSFFDRDYHIMLEDHEDFDEKYWLDLDSNDKFMLVDLMKENIENKNVQIQKKEFMHDKAEEKKRSRLKP